MGYERPDEQAIVEYKVYQLCMTKHGNSLYPMHGFKITEGNIIAKNGPDSPKRQYVLLGLPWNTHHLVILSTLSFIVDYVPDALKEALVEECNAAASRRKELEATATERWGTKLALPGGGRLRVQEGINGPINWAQKRFSLFASKVAAVICQ